MGGQLALLPGVALDQPTDPVVHHRRRHRNRRPVKDGRSHQNPRRATDGHRRRSLRHPNHLGQGHRWSCGPHHGEAQPDVPDLGVHRIDPVGARLVVNFRKSL